MTSIDLKKLLLGTTLIAGFTAFTAAPSFAQDNTAQLKQQRNLPMKKKMMMMKSS